MVDTLLYTPPSPETSRTIQFLHLVNSKYKLKLDSYADLYKWSITHIDEFWGTVWDETGVIGDKGRHVVDVTAKPAANPTWFAEARLNWAENMLRCRSPEKVALIQASGFPSITSLIHCVTLHLHSAEPTPEQPSPPLRKVTYSDLYNLVANLVSALLGQGLKPGDRVASYSSNCIVSGYIKSIKLAMASAAQELDCCEASVVKLTRP